MAKKSTTTPRRTRSKKSSTPETPTSSSARSNRGGTLSFESASGSRDYREILKELASNPAVRYVAAGLTTAILTRVANNLSEKYPEISDFIRDSLDKVDLSAESGGTRH